MEAPSLFDNEEEENEIILCRREDQRAPIEIQADKFASCLLLPREKLVNEFLEFANRPAVKMQPLLRALRHNRDFMNQAFPNWRYIPSDDEVLHYAFKELADTFHVSMQAMVIRLKVIGLLQDFSQEEMSYA